MALDNYPDSLRLPEWAGYGLNSRAGLHRTSMESGYIRQRRQYSHLPTVMNLNFVMTWKQYRNWLIWWNGHAFTWFVMPAVSGFPNPNPTERNCTSHVVRAISDITVRSANHHAYCQISVQVEIGEDTLSLLPIAAGDWYIAHSPANPASDFIIAARPGNPSLDIIEGGRPSIPAVLV